MMRISPATRLLRVNITVGAGFRPAAWSLQRLYSTPTSTELPVLLEIAGPKATFTLNRPRTGNSLDGDMQILLTKHLRALQANHDVRVVVLTANGKYFCTGMNLGAGEKGEGMQGDSEAQFERAALMFRSVEEFPKPVIALIQGSCYGGGNGLAMACDIRIAAKEDLTFTLSEVKLGFIPAIISKYVVREWGVPKSREAMLTARSVPVAELQALSAIHYVLPDLASANAKVDEVVAQLALGAPIAQANVKKLVNSAATEPAEVHSKVIKDFFVEMLAPCEEGKYGLECFQAKTKPDWGSLTRGKSEPARTAARERERERCALRVRVLPKLTQHPRCPDLFPARSSAQQTYHEHVSIRRTAFRTPFAPMLLEVARRLLSRSERVKSIDFHPVEPWIITGLYTGNVVITHVDTGAVIKTFEVTEVPVRCVRFIARRNWFVCGSDDFHLRIFNYNTGEKVTALEAHPDYIRCLAVHPTQSLVLTGSDDMTIKLWDWEKGWKCVQIFEGHTHYIMNLAFNPKDSNTFASACLDRTVKVWSLGSPTANFTLDAHDKGVNYVEYYHGGDKPYLVTTGDDRLIKIWDYLSKSCIQTLEGHTSNVSFAIFHPSLPILVSGSEDGTIKIWHSSTYRLENTLDYGLERAWCVAYAKKGNDVAFGFDEGSVVVKLGREEPSVSMDSAGKVVYARNAEVLMATLQAASTEDGIPDGQKLAVTSRELGNTEIFAQTLQHSPNGRFVTVCGDGEYIIYTSLAWRNKSFGAGVGFAWATDSNTYAVREAGPKVKVFRNFKERPGLLRISYTTDGIYGGTLLGVKGMGFVVFYDWETGAIVRRIDVEARNVYWSGTGNLVAIAGEDSFYVLRFDRDAYNAYLDNGGEVDDEGVEEAFELEADISEVVQTGKWIGDCFVYTNGANRLNYLVGGQTHTITHFDSQMYLLGYLPSHNRIYLCDKDVNFFAFSLSLSVIEYQTAVLRGDLDAAAEILPSVPSEQRNRIARFLETQDLKELALEVSTDPDHKFDLAIQLDDLDTALTLARSSPHLGSQSKWRTVGDRALASWKVGLAEECFKMANDLSALLLIYTSTGDRAGLQALSQTAAAGGLTNIAFACALQLGNSSDCVDLLLATDRAPEAALFSRTFAPSQTPKAVQAWRKTLEAAKKPKQAAALADPSEQPDEFAEGWAQALQREQDVLAGGQLIELPDDDEQDHFEEATDDAPTFQLNGLSIHEQHQQPLVDFGAAPPTEYLPEPAEASYANGNGHVDDDEEEDLLG